MKPSRPSLPRMSVGGDALIHKHRPVLEVVTGEEEGGHQLACSCGLFDDLDGELPEGESFMRHADAKNPRRRR